jgi:RNA polymerase sigma-70 factor (ECF subfamily)
MNTTTTSTLSVAFLPPEVTVINLIDREVGDPKLPNLSFFQPHAKGLMLPHGVASWSDAQLISAVRCDPPNEEALDVLVARHWDALFGRCQMLTLNHQKAQDLAQAAWCRLLRNRQALKPDGNFLAYLTTIATNLFRDSYRSARRAGPLAEHKLASLDVPITNDEGDAFLLESVLPDLNSLQANEQHRLKIDIDAALKKLSPQFREVIVARYIQGESCAEIGRRHGRTEQTVSGWVREALRQMKSHLEEPNHITDDEAAGPKSKTSRTALCLQV